MIRPETWKNFLSEVVVDPSSHYLWLRSLSYLEYIGYRKIVKALSYEKVSREVFHHLSDEIRHSYMLKELADKISVEEEIFGQDFVNMAEGYFQDLDAEVDRWVKDQLKMQDAFLCYLITSYLIELRAMIVYPCYYQKLQTNGERAVIQQIIKDEKEHLNYLKNNTQAIQKTLELATDHLKKFEEGRFEKYIQDFKNALHTKDLPLSA